MSTSAGQTAFLGNLGIKHKALILIGMSVLTAVTMFIVAYTGLAGIKTSADELLLATNVERHALETIVREKEYLLNSNASTSNAARAEAILRETADAIQTINETLDKIGASGNPALTAKAQAARDATKAYAELYHKGVAALGELEKLTRALEHYGQTLSEQVTNYLDAEQDAQIIKILNKIGEFAYIIRANEKRYMMTQKPEIFAQMKADFTTMMENMAVIEADVSTDENRRHVAAFKAAALDYEKAAGKWVAENDLLFKTILPKMKEMGDQVIQLALTAAQDSTVSMTSSHGSTLTRLVIVAVGIAGVALLLGLMVANAISRPVTGLTEAMTRLAHGDLSVEIPSTGQRDEIGTMAVALQVFKNNLIAKKDADEAAAISAGLKVEQAGRMERATREFEQAIGSIVDIVASASSQLSTAAETLSSAAAETTSQSGTVATASSEASANVATVAAAAEQLSASIREITQQVQQSSSIAQVAEREAAQTTGAVQLLNEMTGRIGSIVSLISSIAAQTNMLALNATIEAARAGEAGKGFAVVAAEVKNLAEQTAKATAEITSQITGIQELTRTTSESIGSIAKTIEEINAATAAVADAVEEQGAATQEIARTATETSQATSEVARNITGVQQAAANSGAAANQVLSSSRDLARQSEVLRAEVNKFLNTVRAA